MLYSVEVAPQPMISCPRWSNITNPAWKTRMERGLEGASEEDGEEYMSYVLCLMSYVLCLMSFVLNRWLSFSIDQFLGVAPGLSMRQLNDVYSNV
jgi:hypothetical protein